MKCPILSITDEREGRDGYPQGADCIQEECAWWDPSYKVCAIRTVTWVIVRLVKKFSEGL